MNALQLIKDAMLQPEFWWGYGFGIATLLACWGAIFLIALCLATKVKADVQVEDHDEN
jgi:hypothetical protein